MAINGSSSALSAPAPAPTPSWFTPKRLLFMFCFINLVIYMDRGAFASNGVNGSPRKCNFTCIDYSISQIRVGMIDVPIATCLNDRSSLSQACTNGNGIQGDFNLSNFEDGVLSSIFLVGLLVSLPIFAHMAKSINPFRIIGVGLSVWTLAVLGCSFSVNFWTIAVCRLLVGVGDASFLSLAAPFIDENSPPNQKTVWLGIFYMCTSTGFAIGYIYGGIVGSIFSWRHAFYGEAILMLPFAILGFLLHPLQLKGFIQTENATDVEDMNSNLSENAGILVVKCGIKFEKFSISNEFLSFFKDLKMLLAEKVFAVNVLGYIAYNFVIGSYSFWGPKAGRSIYMMNNADYLYGGVTVASGIIGTIAGGFALDLITPTIQNAFKLLSWCSLLGAVSCFSAYLFNSIYPFFVLFTIGQTFLFATQGPVNYTSLHCVKPSLRPLSMSLSTVFIHIFGDVPSPPLVGVLQDHLRNWRISILAVTSIFFVASIVWFAGIFLHTPETDETSHVLLGDD